MLECKGLMGRNYTTFFETALFVMFLIFVLHHGTAANRRGLALRMFYLTKAILILSFVSLAQFPLLRSVATEALIIKTKKPTNETQTLQNRMP